MPRVQAGARQLNASRSATAITAACCSSLSGAKLARSPWDGKQACHKAVQSTCLSKPGGLPAQVCCRQVNAAHHGVCKLPSCAKHMFPPSDNFC